MEKLREHNVHLSDGSLRLRPMTEGDLEMLLKWNNDPEVLFYLEGDDIRSWSLEDMQGMYRGTSQHAFVFIIELDGRLIGECWLQEMNIDSVKERYPGLDVRRIDLMIGEKDLWGQGWGTKVIGLLMHFAFEECDADVIHEPGIGDHNPRSRRAFESNGFTVVYEVDVPKGNKAKIEYHLALTKDEYAQRTGGCADLRRLPTGDVPRHTPGGDDDQA